MVKKFKDGNNEKNMQVDLDIVRCLFEFYEILESAYEKQASSTQSKKHNKYG